MYLFYHKNSPSIILTLEFIMEVHLNFIIMNITLEKCNVFVIAQNITTIVF